MKNIYITWSYKVRFGVGFPDSVEKSALSRWKVSAGGLVSVTGPRWVDKCQTWVEREQGVHCHGRMPGWAGL